MSIELAVVGAHLRGQPLHAQLVDLAASFIRDDATTDEYRLFALDTVPPKPGLVRVVPGSGAAIAVEVYSLDTAAFGVFVGAVPAPLCIGRLRLRSGVDVAGFLCEPIATNGALDITTHGGWRAFLDSCR